PEHRLQRGPGPRLKKEPGARFRGHERKEFRVNRGCSRMALTPTPRGDRPAIAAEAFLRALADHGVDYFFCNPGTDFPPVIEAFSRARKTNAKVPKPVLVPHENLAVSMAHGAYLMTGRPQAVMVHV